MLRLYMVRIGMLATGLAMSPVVAMGQGSLLHGPSDPLGAGNRGRVRAGTSAEKPVNVIRVYNKSPGKIDEVYVKTPDVPSWRVDRLGVNYVESNTSYVISSRSRGEMHTGCIRTIRVVFSSATEWQGTVEVCEWRFLACQSTRVCHATNVAPIRPPEPR